ncbi:MAG TPA: HEAT repeat domain-containing protein [Verrucomicrobiae bacterium]|nr:HEAT repeat domain-containing protein [Verrucomicrobiae bacterium]
MKKLAKSASWWCRFFESSDAEEIHQIISELSPLDLATLDQRVRESWTTYRYYNLQNWQNLRPSDVGRLAQSKFATSLVGLASFHFSGYVREAAVAELALQRTGKELPFLLIRLNDWVSQVRDAAARAVRVRIEPTYAVHFLANISLVLRLRICGRVEKKFVDDICDLLKRAECKDILQAGTTSKDKAVRRISFQLAAEAEPSTRAAIIRAAMTDPDAVARSWAARHFLPAVSLDELPEVIEPMLKDRFMPVRRDALWYAAAKRPDIAKQPLRAALLDNHISMRETARQFLAVAEVKDAAGFYADAIANGSDKQRFAAICGLGETGKAADVPLVMPFLNSPLTKIRRAATYAIGKLNLEGQLERLVGVLSDAKPSVSREALKALQSKARYIALVDLENLFVNAADFHVRRNTLTLILHTDKWKKVPVLLKACADKDERIAKQAAKALRAWSINYNSSFAEPTRDDFQRISSALIQFESHLPHGFAAELRSCLKIYFK